MKDFEQLNLDTHIDDTVLDEVFSNENDRYSTIISNEDDEVQINDDIETQRASIKTNQLNKMKAHTDLSNEDLIMLIRNNIETEKHKRLLAIKNSGLVYRQAFKCSCIMDFDDKVANGFLGLTLAMNTYDLNSQYTFTTYAGRSIKQNMYRHGNRESRDIPIPEHMSKNNIIVQKFIIEYVQKNGTEPTEQQIHISTGISLKQVKALMNVANALSLDTAVDDSTTLSETLTSDGDDYKLDESIFSVSLEDALKTVFDKLDVSERTIISLVSGVCGNRSYSFDEITKMHYVDKNGYIIYSKSTLLRRYNDALLSLKSAIERENIVIKS